MGVWPSRNINRPVETFKVRENESLGGFVGFAVVGFYVLLLL